MPIVETLEGSQVDIPEEAFHRIEKHLPKPGTRTEKNEVVLITRPDDKRPVLKEELRGVVPRLQIHSILVPNVPVATVVGFSRLSSTLEIHSMLISTDKETGRKIHW